MPLRASSHPGSPQLFCPCMVQLLAGIISLRPNPGRSHGSAETSGNNYIMTSSNGNIFRVIGPLWGESTGHQWIPLTKASDAKLWCFLWSAPERKYLSKQSRRWWFETPLHSLWRHCNSFLICCQALTWYFTHICLKRYPWNKPILHNTYNEMKTIKSTTQKHTPYNDVIMTTRASQITSLKVVYSTVYSDADQRKHQSSASLAFVWGIHRWIPRRKGQLRGKYFHLMTSSWIASLYHGNRHHHPPAPKWQPRCSQWQRARQHAVNNVWINSLGPSDAYMHQ